MVASAVGLVALRAGRKNRLIFLPLFCAVAFAAVLVGVDLGMLIEPEFGGQAEPQIKNVLHVGLSVGGLLAIENLLRNIDEEQRRKLWSLCVALGAMFAFELFMYAERLMVPAADPTLPEGRGIIGFLAVPLIALAIVRNREWRIDIHVSRAVVLHTATLLATGAFFLCLSAIGIIVRQLGGGWGPAAATTMPAGGACAAGISGACAGTAGASGAGVAAGVAGGCASTRAAFASACLSSPCKTATSSAGICVNSFVGL